MKTKCKNVELLKFENKIVLDYKNINIRKIEQITNNWLRIYVISIYIKINEHNDWKKSSLRNLSNMLYFKNERVLLNSNLTYRNYRFLFYFLYYFFVNFFIILVMTCVEFFVNFDRFFVYCFFKQILYWEHSINCENWHSRLF